MYIFVFLGYVYTAYCIHFCIVDSFVVLCFLCDYVYIVYITLSRYFLLIEFYTLCSVLLLSFGHILHSLLYCYIFWLYYAIIVL